MKARAIKVILNCISTTRDVRKLFQITLNLGGYRIVEKGLEIRTAEGVSLYGGPGHSPLENS